MSGSHDKWASAGYFVAMAVAFLAVPLASNKIAQLIFGIFGWAALLAAYFTWPGVAHWHPIQKFGLPIATTVILLSALWIRGSLTDIGETDIGEILAAHLGPQAATLQLSPQGGSLSGKVLLVNDGADVTSWTYNGVFFGPRVDATPDRIRVGQEIMRRIRLESKKGNAAIYSLSHLQEKWLYGVDRPLSAEEVRGYLAGDYVFFFAGIVTIKNDHGEKELEYCSFRSGKEAPEMLHDCPIAVK